ncbi:MAG: hypothetical protein JJ902_05375 [Roseibium sp.]|nr:hypothetical protein [Roseibium sp.]
MALTFDTLAYAKTLQEKGVPREQAEAHADAARSFIMADLVTKEDLRIALEIQTNKLTLRVGSMLTAVIGFYVLMEQFFT